MELVPVRSSGLGDLRVGNWVSWGSLEIASSHLPPGVGELRRTWRKVLARGWGFAASCKAMLMLQMVEVSRLP